MIDLWVSMIENWGEVNKEYNHHCDKVNLQKCLVKLSKYFWRTLSAMKALDRFIPPFRRKGLIDFSGEMNPEAIMDHWLQTYKRNCLDEINNTEIERERLNIFFTKFGCRTEAISLFFSFSHKCLESINQFVVRYTAELPNALPLQTGRFAPKL